MAVFYYWLIQTELTSAQLHQKMRSTIDRSEDRIEDSRELRHQAEMVLMSMKNFLEEGGWDGSILYYQEDPPTYEVHPLSRRLMPIISSDAPLQQADISEPASMLANLSCHIIANIIDKPDRKVFDEYCAKIDDE